MNVLDQLEELCAAAKIRSDAAYDAGCEKQQVLFARWKLSAAELYDRAAQFGIENNYFGEKTAMAGLNAVELWYNCGCKDNARKRAKQMFNDCCEQYTFEEYAFLERIADQS